MMKTTQLNSLDTHIIESLKHLAMQFYLGGNCYNTW